MEQIIRFVTPANSERFTVSELCEQFGISRKTGSKHLERYAASGLKGLQPCSHAPRALEEWSRLRSAAATARRMNHLPTRSTSLGHCDVTAA